MFWKLHMHDREKDLTEFSQMLLEFLSYVAQQPGDALDEEMFRLQCPQFADWFLPLLRGTEVNKRNFQEAVKKLFLLPIPRRQAIEQAVGHDMKFDCAGAGKHFFFMFPKLLEEEQHILHNYFLYFYEVTFHHRRGVRINGHTCQATRGALSEAYFRANRILLHACPICLHQKSNAAREEDLEHYFPKARYPVLALHPYNLMMICKECNETYKRCTDVLAGGEKSLKAVFRPYRDTVKEQTVVSVQRMEETGTDRIKLRAINDSVDTEEKIRNFDRQYQLEERWSAEIGWIFEQWRTLYAGQGVNKEELRKDLEKRCGELHQLADYPDKFLESVYANWLLGTQLDAFYESLQ